MGFRFRKSIKILPGIRLNLSKSGISTSIGGPGASINFGGQGTRQTVGLPGTGLSFSSLSSAGAGADDPSSNRAANISGKGCGCLAIGALLLFAIGMCVPKPNPNSNDPAAAGTSSSSDAGQAEAKGLTEASYAAGDEVLVNAQSLNARASPTGAGRVVGHLKKGERLKVLERKGDWIKVAQGAALVWILSSHVSRSRPGATNKSQGLLQPKGKRLNSSKAKPQQSQYTGGNCPCIGSRVCIGPRGGRYCITTGGRKRYGV